MGVDIETVLVPVDGTDEAKRAVEYAIAVADRYDAGVHVLHVIDEDVARQVRTDETAAESVASDHQSFLDDIFDTIDAAGDGPVPVTSSVAIGFSSSRLTHHPVSVVLDTAAEVAADFIVIPRESIREDPSAMLGKVAQYVLSYASQPVLSV